MSLRNVSTEFDLLYTYDDLSMRFRTDISKAKEDNIYRVIRYRIDHLGTGFTLDTVQYMSESKAEKEGYLRKI